jgi:hypothetical protein
VGRFGRYLPTGNELRLRLSGITETPLYFVLLLCGNEFVDPSCLAVRGRIHQFY